MSTENEGVENAIRQKFRGKISRSGNCRSRSQRVEFAWVEYATYTHVDLAAKSAQHGLSVL